MSDFISQLVSTNSRDKFLQGWLMTHVNLLLLATVALFNLSIPGVVQADSMLPRTIDNEKLIKKAECVVIGELTDGRLNSNYGLDLKIKIILASTKCANKSALNFTAPTGLNGYIKFPLIGQKYLVVLDGSEKGYWLFHAEQSVMPVSQFEENLLEEKGVKEFFSHDKVPLSSFIKSHGFTWISGLCAAEMTFHNIIDPCIESTKTLSFFLNYLNNQPNR